MFEYHVAYQFQAGHSTGFGDIDIGINTPALGRTDIPKIREFIENKLADLPEVSGRPKVIILNWIRLATQQERTP